MEEPITRSDLFDLGLRGEGVRVVELGLGLVSEAWLGFDSWLLLATVGEGEGDLVKNEVIWRC